MHENWSCFGGGQAGIIDVFATNCGGLDEKWAIWAFWRDWATLRHFAARIGGFKPRCGNSRQTGIAESPGGPSEGGLRRRPDGQEHVEERSDDDGQVHGENGQDGTVHPPHASTESPEEEAPDRRDERLVEPERVRRVREEKCHEAVGFHHQLDVEEIDGLRRVAVVEEPDAAEHPEELALHPTLGAAVLAAALRTPSIDGRGARLL